jgi:hypothetical protein
MRVREKTGARLEAWLEYQGEGRGRAIIAGPAGDYLLQNLRLAAAHGVGSVRVNLYNDLDGSARKSVFACLEKIASRGVRVSLNRC